MNDNLLIVTFFLYHCLISWGFFFWNKTFEEVPAKPNLILQREAEADSSKYSFLHVIARDDARQTYLYYKTVEESNVHFTCRWFTFCPETLCHKICEQQIGINEWACTNKEDSPVHSDISHVLIISWGRGRWDVCLTYIMTPSTHLQGCMSQPVLV